jgi:transposase
LMILLVNSPTCVILSDHRIVKGVALMSQLNDLSGIPTETARVAHAAFRKPNVYMAMRDQLGVLYGDGEFAPLFSSPRGRPAESPGVLALVTVMQFAEGLTDRQAAEAVRARIDWKYALGLELTDSGFDYSLLTDFREQLLATDAVERLLDDMLKRFMAMGLLKARMKQRTDSTHVLAAVRRLNRLEMVGETLRYALNELAAVDPQWLGQQVTADWRQRYAHRFEQYRLPKSDTERADLARTVGADGQTLLAAVYAPHSPPPVRQCPAVEILRQVWVQQYEVRDGLPQWRTEANLPPARLLIQSPYDPEARNRTKRELNLTGYMVHLTETCESDSPHFITEVETTVATVSDKDMAAQIQAALATKGLLPDEHLVDAGYIDAEVLVSSAAEYGIELCGPAQADASWQAHAEGAFGLSCFTIDWQAKTAICPQGQVSCCWSTATSQGKPVIEVAFNQRTCRTCPCRSRCTRSKHGPRTLKLHPEAQHDALQKRRQEQMTTDFKERYKKRAGIEGTIAQGTRSLDLRKSRYRGLNKTRLQHVIIAAAMNLTRFAHWTLGIPRAKTRISHFAAMAAA